MFVHSGTNSHLYEWNCSALDTDTNFYALPNLDGLIEDAEVVRGIGLSSLDFVPSNTVVLYPVPTDLNCSGMISAVKFCYFIYSFQFEVTHEIFSLLLLEWNQLNFRVITKIEISSTPVADICSRTITGSQYCCDVETISQFYLPTSNQ